MVFEEIYSMYYSIIASILSQASTDSLSQGQMEQIARAIGYEESWIAAAHKFSNGEWPLMDENKRSVLKHAPVRLLTLEEKRWMKAILDDPRIQLFDLSDKGLEDIEPLYDLSLFRYYDQDRCGDPYQDAHYKLIFQTVLEALLTRHMLEVKYATQKSGNERVVKWRIAPVHLEYSPKNDKFRLIGQDGSGRATVLNLSNIQQISLLNEEVKTNPGCVSSSKKTVTLRLHDQRDVLMRAMMHFSDLSKTTTKTGEREYEIEISYYPEDESEILMRILGFGPMVEIIGESREGIVKQMRKKIEQQKKMRNSK